jgi:uncharacterized protein YcfJ
MSHKIMLDVDDNEYHKMLDFSVREKPHMSSSEPEKKEDDASSAVPLIALAGGLLGACTGGIGLAVVGAIAGGFAGNWVDNQVKPI